MSLLQRVSFEFKVALLCVDLNLAVTCILKFVLVTLDERVQEVLDWKMSHANGLGNVDLTSQNAFLFVGITLFYVV